MEAHGVFLSSIIGERVAHDRWQKPYSPLPPTQANLSWTGAYVRGAQTEPSERAGVLEQQGRIVALQVIDHLMPPHTHTHTHQFLPGRIPEYTGYDPKSKNTERKINCPWA